MRSLVVWTRTGAPPGLEVCLEGEVWAVLDEGETLMHPGDVRIQRVPLWTSVLVRTYAWMVLLGRRGLVNEGLQSLGLLDAPLPLLYNRLGVNHRHGPRAAAVRTARTGPLASVTVITNTSRRTTYDDSHDAHRESAAARRPDDVAA